MSDSFSLGGNSNPSFSFGPQGSQPGASITGTVLDLAEVQQMNFDTKKPEFWDNGDPKMQHRLTLQTQLRDPLNPNDTGVRDVYLRGRRKPHENGARSTICAVLDAVREATGSVNIAKGGTITLQWISGMGFSGDPRNYVAKYAPPAMSLGSQQPTQTTGQAPVQQQQPAASAAPPAWAQPAAQAPAQQVATEQGLVNSGTGEIAQPGAAQAPTAGPVYPPGVSAEAVAAVKAAGQNPAVIFPGYSE